MYILSDKLQTFFVGIEEATKRKVNIVRVPDVGMPGMIARFVEHPADIRVEVIQSIQQGEVLEQSVAHEATHGLLAYGKGYCKLLPTRSLSKIEVDSISILVTMIEDIVVNKTLQENGFSPFSPTYLDTVGDETKAFRKNRDYYSQFQEPFKSRFLVFRYIMAWGFLQYFTLDTLCRKILRRFENEFRLSCPQQYKAGSQIREIIMRCNIFWPNGYCHAIKESLKLWDLASIVNVSMYT